MIGTRLRERGRFLNKIDKVAFEAWVETGSLDNARLYFEKQKILHDNGKQYSVAGIRFCAMRYMVRNYDETMAILLNEYHKKGIPANQESLETTLVSYAIEVLKYKQSILEWADQHGLLEKYQTYIDERTKHAPVESRRASIIRQV